MKKAKENWTGEQCSEIEENLRKNNSKRACQLIKYLTTVKQEKAATVQDHSGKCLTEEWEILNRWTEYSTELYNYKANGDPSVLDCSRTDTEDDHPILCKEVEAVVQSLKKGRSAGVDNIPAELIQAGGEDVITALTTICNKIWQTGEWLTPWTQSLVITLPKKGNVLLTELHPHLQILHENGNICNLTQKKQKKNSGQLASSFGVGLLVHCGRIALSMQAVQLAGAEVQSCVNRTMIP